jgi:putative addiction module component (TIGR02574 family)
VNIREASICDNSRDIAHPASIVIPSGPQPRSGEEDEESVFASRAAIDIIQLMTEEAQELLQKAMALPENERAELAGNLISSLDATVDQDADAAWQQEVVRRLHQVQCGEVATVAWEEVQRKGHTLLHGK